MPLHSFNQRGPQHEGSKQVQSKSLRKASREDRDEDRLGVGIGQVLGVEGRFTVVTRKVWGGYTVAVVSG